jgi:PAS domain S-box-containing protein
VAEWAQTVREGQIYSTGGRVWHEASSSYHHFIVRAVPIRGADGTLAEWIGTITDIHDRMRAEESLRETKQRLDAVLDNATVAIFLMDESQQCVYVNAAAEQLTGYTFAEIRGRSLHDVIHHTRPDGRPYPVSECPIGRTLSDNNREAGEEVFVHKDGTFYPVAFAASPIRDRGRTVGTIIEVRDIRGEKAAQERQRLLTHELNHRVKNTLAIMQSIAGMTARFTPEPEAFRQAFSARLIAIARVHDILTRGAWSGATLKEVVEVTLAPYTALGFSAVEVRGPHVTLDPTSVLAYSMALHELATNAAKYGALSLPGGRVFVCWNLEQNGARVLELTWREAGGPAVEKPSRTGFGSKLIQGLAGQLEAEIALEYPPEGVACHIRAPLPEVKRTGL